MATKSASEVHMTLPGRYYSDPQVFAEELERFYCQDWICAGRSEQVEKTGQYFLREIGKESIIITRDPQLGLRAYFNVCRHRGTRICTQAEGAFSGRIQCGYHGWTYGLDGRLIGAPHMQEVDFNREEFPLHKVNIAEWDGNIFINLSKDPQPLEAQLADLPEKFRPWRMQELRLVKRIVYEVKCNWKLVILNYNECLHCPVLHPLLNRLTDYLGADNEQPQSTYVGGSMGFKGDAETMSLDGKRRRNYLPGLQGSDRERVCYYAILPNFLLSLHPDYMMAHTLWPRAANRTEVVCEWHFHPEEMKRADFDPTDAIEFWDITNREDWGISELSQLGIQSRAYQPGPYSEREGLLHAFDRIVLGREAEDKNRKR